MTFYRSGIGTLLIKWPWEWGKEAKRPSPRQVGRLVVLRWRTFPLCSYVRLVKASSLNSTFSSFPFLTVQIKGSKLKMQDFCLLGSKSNKTTLFQVWRLTVYWILYLTINVKASRNEVPNSTSRRSVSNETLSIQIEENNSRFGSCANLSSV